MFPYITGNIEMTTISAVPVTCDRPPEVFTSAYSSVMSQTLEPKEF